MLEVKKIDALKAILVFILFVWTFAFTLVPFALRNAALRHPGRRQFYLSIFSLLSCFGGGVFLATCLLDLLPEAREKLTDGLTTLGLIDGNFGDFPLPEFFVALGFFLILIMEQIGVYFKEMNAEDNLVVAGQPELPDENIAIVADIRRQQSVIEGISDRPRVSVSVSRRGQRRVSTSQGSHISSVVISNSEHTENAVEPLVNFTTEIPQYGSIERSTSSDSSNHDSTASLFDDSMSTLRAILLVAALSLHSCFEGLAVGVQQDKLKALQLCGALAIHKCVIGFSLGLRLVQSRMSTGRIVLCDLTFCTMALLGGLLGILISESVSNRYTDVVNGSLQGIACGTFLYITFFEVKLVVINIFD